MCKYLSKNCLRYLCNYLSNEWIENVFLFPEYIEVLRAEKEAEDCQLTEVSTALSTKVSVEVCLYVYVALTPTETFAYIFYCIQ